MSLESTGCSLPSYTTALTSTTGYPATGPDSSVWRTPFSVEAMNGWEMAPPTTSEANSKPAPRSSGSTRRCTSANCPAPPVCFLWR